MIELPAKMDKSSSSSSNGMNLTCFIIFARGCSKLELLLDSHGCDDFLGHATRRQVVVPIVAVRIHHSNVEANKENDQIGGISKILIFLVLHESDDFVDDNGITHVNEYVYEDASRGPVEAILESYQNGQQNVFVLLGIEHFFDFLQLNLDQIVISQSAQVLQRELIRL